MAILDVTGLRRWQTAVYGDNRPLGQGPATLKAWRGPCSMSWEKGNALAAHGSEPDQRGCPHEIHTTPRTLRPDLRASLTRVALVVSAAAAAVPGTMAALVAAEFGRAVGNKMVPGTMAALVAAEFGRAVGNKMVPCTMATEFGRAVGNKMVPTG
ncbi:MAG: hypothetical protein V3W33_03660, partial [Gammaproteobacteria bacterium]